MSALPNDHAKHLPTECGAHQNRRHQPPVVTFGESPFAINVETKLGRFCVERCYNEYPRIKTEQCQYFPSRPSAKQRQTPSRDQ